MFRLLKSMRPASGFGGCSGEEDAAGFPSVLEVRACNQAAQAQDDFGSGFAPEHAGLFESAPDDGFAPHLDGAIGANPAQIKRPSARSANFFVRHPIVERAEIFS